MKELQMAVHDRLKFAREKAALTGPQVNERTGIGVSSLSEFESGKREPSMSQLSNLAKVYNRSTAFFLDSGPLPVDPRVMWKMRPAVAAEETATLFLQLCSQYHNLESWCNEKVKDCLPQAEGNAKDFGDVDADKLAKRVRDDLQLGDRPGQCLLAVLEEVCKVKIFHLDFEPAGTAASVRSDDYGAAILLNVKNPPWRRNEDLAHELFHLLTWNIFRNANDDTSPSEIEETLAGHFAANLLMPAEPFRISIKSRMKDDKISVDSLYNVAREYNVPVEAVIYRLHNIFLNQPESHEQVKKDLKLVKEFTRSLEQTDDKDNNLKPHKYPQRYRALAIKALRHGEIATGKFASYLSISRKEAQQFEQEVLNGEEVQVAIA